MSREIKFRAWGNNIKEYMSQCFDGEVEIANVTRILGDLIDQGNWVVEQYTGLTDKNGKEIYEGDIVKGEMGVFEVRWVDAIASFCFKPNTEMKWHPNCNQGTTDYMEVIGNIHENSELLGGGE